MAKFNKVDLQFILQQIQMAETNQPPTSPHLAFGLREVAGTDNNQVPGQGTFGSVDQPFPTVAPQIFQTVTVNIDGTMFDPNPLVDGDTMTTSYTQTAATGPQSVVVDTAPRIISNLISDQSSSNPAAVEAANAFAAQLGDGYTVQNTIVFDSAATNPTNSLFIGNITPDAGLSAPFNSWMTLFGQFFDHGLDLINKGNAGTVLVPLMPDDPLVTVGPDGIAGTGDEIVIGDPSTPAFMALTRATNVQVLPGADGQLGTSDDIHRNINATTPFVDQNQTYASHPSHQVFLREYQIGSDGKLHTTGKLLTGANGGMATWADVKANALKLGIKLTDKNVGDVPLLKTDDYGNFIPAANGYAQVAVKLASGIVVFVSGKAGGLDLTNPIADNALNPAGTIGETVLGTGHAFINDIAHAADPTGKTADTDTALGLANADASSTATNYDNELLDAHYMAGDGRANENFGLTAVHEVFHSEHNRLVAQIKDLIRAELAAGDSSFASDWVLPSANLADGIQETEWNGERIFQAAKFGTETQYQHLVFEEFARKIAPTIHLFGNVDIHLDPAITSEFANAVYRFGHSMLDETVPRFELNPDGTTKMALNSVSGLMEPVLLQTDQNLISAFLNPVEYAARGADAAAEIVQGTTHQIGNEIDEFVTGALRNNLLGLPLDLAALNIARGRDTGVPPINVLRHQLFAATGDTTLKPYANWAEFGQFLKHAGSLVNFVAAYGTHASILAATSLADKRIAAADLISAGLDPSSQGSNSLVNSGGTLTKGEAYDFMHSLGAYADDLGNPIAVHAQWSNGNITGLDTIDLWIGGLAEKQSLFGGLLGSTFNFIFETQLENLQDADRLYYLPRIEGMHWGTEIEANSFAEMIMNNTGAKHLPGSIFLTPEYTVEAGDYFLKNPDGSFQHDANGNRIAVDQSQWLRNPVAGNLLVEVLADGTVHFIGDDNFFGNTMVLGGTAEADRLLAGNADDDTVWGDGGNDTLDGGEGNDFIYGGTGDDKITDAGGLDVIHGEDGNDDIDGGLGDDIITGNDGDDFIHGGAGIDAITGGQGNDIMFGDEDDDEILGNEGDDWVAGGAGGDLLVGDHGAPTGQVPLIAGNDVIDGGTNGDRMQGFSGDDIMMGLGGFDKFEGRLGYDWADFEQEGHGVSVDMNRRELIPDPLAPAGDAVRDFFIETEGVSGSAFDDVLQGTSRAIVDPLFNELTNFNLIIGLKGAPLVDDGSGQIRGGFFADGTGFAPEVFSFSDGNIMLGGDGNDTLEGRQGNDVLDGDAWLHVELLENENGQIGAGSQILREIRYDTTSGDIDTAVFSDVMANYFVDLTGDEQGFVTVSYIGPLNALVSDGTDRLRNIERLQFADAVIALNPFAPGANQAPSSFDGINPAVQIQGDTNIATAIVDPVVGSALTADVSNLRDYDFFIDDGDPLNDGIITSPVSYQWQMQDLARPRWVNIAGATDASFTPGNGQIGMVLRLMVTYTDPTGYVEHAFSPATAVVAPNLATNTAPQVVAQQGFIGLQDTTALEDQPINLNLPVVQAFTDHETASNLLTYTATLANGADLSTMGLSFNLIPDLVNGGVLRATLTGNLPANFFGPLSIRVTATDAGPGSPMSVTDTFIINVLNVADAPVAVDDNYVVIENGVLNVTTRATGVLGNDSDPDNNPITAQLVSGPSNGTLTLNANGTFTYTPDSGFSGTDSFTYHAIDSTSRTSPDATVTITVDPVNDAPTGVSLLDPIAGTAIASVAVDENLTNVTVADIAIADDGIGSNTVTLTGADAGSFAVVGTELRFIGPANFESGKTAYDVTVNVQDLTVPGSPAVTSDLHVTINDVNEAPTAVTVTPASPSLTVRTSGPENGGDIIVAQLGWVDDALGTNALHVLPGLDSAHFSIDGSNRLHFLGGDFEAQQSYTVTLAARDTLLGTGAQTDFTFSVTNANDAATGAITVAKAAAGTTTFTATNGVVDQDVVLPNTIGTQWQVFNGSSWTNIAGATSSSFTAGAAEAGKLIRAAAVYTDPFSPGGVVIGSNEKALIGTSASETLSSATTAFSALGTGPTIMVGLGGNDTYRVSSEFDTIVETVGGGSDMVGSSKINIDLNNYANVEKAYVAGAGLSITGTAAANWLYGDTHSSANGLFGGLESDTYVVGAGDWVDDSGGVWDTLLTRSAFNLDLTTVKAGGGLAYVGIEILRATSGSTATLSGDGSVNVLDGQSSNGANHLFGRGGNDIYDVGAGDVVHETAADGGSGRDTVRSSTINLDLGNYLDVEAATLTGNAALSLTAAVDRAATLTGNGAANTIVGGNLADILIGGSGADVLTGGGGRDQFRFAAVSDSTAAATDVILDFQEFAQIGPNFVGDVIDLRQIDAVPGGAHTAFAYHALGDASAVALGDLRQHLDGTTMVVDFYINSTSVADMTIRVNNHAFNMGANDFLL